MSSARKRSRLVIPLPLSLAGAMRWGLPGAALGSVVAVYAERLISLRRIATLTATPAANSTFGGWSGGACSGTGPCTLTMDVPHAVTARFELAFALAPLHAVATRSGLGTSASLRQHLRAVAGVSPSAYRRTFRGRSA